MSLGDFLKYTIPAVQNIKLADMPSNEAALENYRQRAFESSKDFFEPIQKGQAFVRENAIRNETAKLYNAPGLSEQQKLSGLSDIYGKAGEASSAISLSEKAQERKDSELAKKLETFSKISNALSLVYDGTLNSTKDKERALSDANRTLDGFIQSGIGGEIEPVLRQLADNGKPFGFKKTEDRQLKFINTADGKVQIVDATTALPAGQSSIVIPNSKAEGETLQEFKDKKMAAARIELDTESRKLEIKRQINAVEEAQKVVREDISERVKSYSQSLDSLSKIEDTLNAEGASALTPGLLPLGIAKVYDDGKVSDADAERASGSKSLYGRTRRYISILGEGKLPTSDIDTYRSWLVAMKTGLQLNKNRQLLNLVDSPRALQELGAEVAILPVGKENIVGTFSNSNDPLLKRSLRNGTLKALSDNGYTFLVNGRKYSVGKENELIPLDVKPESSGSQITSKTGKTAILPYR